MSIEEKMGVDTLAVRAWGAWKDFVNMYHDGGVPDNVGKLFKALWYPESHDPVDPQFAKAMIQQAFLNGFQEGFTSRLLRGEINESNE